MEGPPKFSLEKLVGTFQVINPTALLNKKRLYTTQSWVNMAKLKNALEGKPDVNEEPPTGWVTMYKGNVAYVIGDGNHRVGLACIEGGEVPFYVQGILPEGGDYYGFNIITQKIKSELRGSIGAD